MFGRRKRAEVAILNVLSGEWTYGLDLMRLTKLRPGRFYVAMDRLTDVGAVERVFEKTDDGRPRRALYRLRGTYVTQR